MHIDLVELFCSIDDFWINFEKEWNQILLSSGEKTCTRRRSLLYPSEVMTIIILFHMSSFRNFKTFYLGYVSSHLSNDFSKLPSYT